MDKSSDILIIGVGNVYRSDDAIGIFIADKIRQKATDGIVVVIASGEGGELLEYFKTAPFVILIDAVQTGGPPGEIYRFEAHNEKVPSKFFNYSTHNFSVAEAVEMARALEQLPEKLVLYGIEGASFEAGQDLSPEIEQVAKIVIEKIRGEIKDSL